MGRIEPMPPMGPIGRDTIDEFWGSNYSSGSGWE